MLDPLEGAGHRVLEAPASAGLGIDADRVVGQLHPAHVLPGGEQRQAPVQPAIGGIGITQQGLDLLLDSPSGPMSVSGVGIGRGGLGDRLPPDDSPREAVGHRQFPVKAVGPGHQLQSGQ